MKFKSLLNESYECIKINGILRNLTNDEMKIYKKVKAYGKVFKQELSEYDANVATTMVSKGILRRKKAQHDEGHGRIYYIARGRKGHLKGGELDEVAPPGKESEKWIKKNKKRFKEKYGKDYEKYLYGKAWNNYNGKKKIKESIEDVSSFKNEGKELIEKYKKLINCLNSISQQELDNKFLNFKNDLTKFTREYKNDGKFIEDLYYTTDNANDALIDTLEEKAYDSGDYGQYYDDEYDAQETHQEIENQNAFGNIIKDVLPGRFIIKIFNKLISAAHYNIDNQESNNKEPEFDGNFDEITSIPNDKTSNPMDNDYEEDMKSLNQIVKIGTDVVAELTANETFDRNYIYQAYNKIVDLSENMHDYYNDISEGINSTHDIIFEYYDEYMNDNDDDPYVHIVEGEFDSDATWESIHEESDERLVLNYGISSMYKDYLERIEDSWDEFVKTFNENYLGLTSQNDDPDDDGSEYNE